MTRRELRAAEMEWRTEALDRPVTNFGAYDYITRNYHEDWNWLQHMKSIIAQEIDQ